VIAPGVGVILVEFHYWGGPYTSWDISGTLHLERYRLR
jgi:hypothetical protein